MKTEVLIKDHHNIGGELGSHLPPHGYTTLSVGDVVYYGEDKQKGIVSSIIEGCGTHVFVRFNGPTGERTPVSMLSK